MSEAFRDIEMRRTEDANSGMVEQAAQAAGQPLELATADSNEPISSCGPRGEMPVLESDETPSMASFPILMMPPLLRAFVAELAAETRLPDALIGPVVLAAVSASIGAGLVVNTFGQQKHYLLRIVTGEPRHVL